MKKILVYVLVCITLLCTTGCGCSRIGEKSSPFYNKDLSFDFDEMSTISTDLREAIEKGLEDASPVKMTNGHFRIENNNSSYNYGEGTTKTKVNFYTFEVDARPEENNSIVIFKGLITIDFENTVDGSEYGGNYTIKSKDHKEIEFEIDNRGTAVYDEETGNFTIVIPELIETGTITQTGQTTTIAKGGYEDVAEPKTNTWSIDDTWKNVKISFTPHTES